ncbi:ADP-ribose pyrophosphatase YjhB, NUDIX family [Chryseolinea serpens]|jgi:8-oxo-dGTP pyrophosphatase MutT (NUDIX family)|uniref:ADP-ribose pyrophosphatase YjhB, NUDIX family n=1 Tax=Chryseolinea serpens TaxID=947013 RepID=A0A1M5U6K0_9BACT|nr:NUDIX domain-containing protein [Chryseolinea serpens]SHH58569.1 ADP-ribose pyrophosphatase YjhB, NUDIX family [Chryseolinea serpens]
MIIFINDIPVRILKADEQPGEGRVNHIIDAAQEPVTQAKLIYHVWIQNVGEQELNTLLNFLDAKVPTSVLSISVSVKDYDITKQYLRSKFKVVKAAGGLVRKKDKFLMIYRLKKWDLPKGKREKDETSKQAAVREVEEECNVTVKLGQKICTTWHTYTMNKRAMIKKTRWYVMDVVDDTRMRPQPTEDIEETRWMNRKEVYHALEHSYKSINYVFEQYYEVMEINPAK